MADELCWRIIIVKQTPSSLCQHLKDNDSFWLMITPDGKKNGETRKPTGLKTGGKRTSGRTL